MSSLTCPRCKTNLSTRTAGELSFGECGTCFGVWVDAPSFEKISADPDKHGADLSWPDKGPTNWPVVYIPCAECGTVMNRINFWRVSGVVVDICQRHGIWFDRDELRQVMDFVRKGGLREARAIELAEHRSEMKELRAVGKVGSARGEKFAAVVNFLIGS